MDEWQIKLNLIEIDLLLYVLDARLRSQDLGDHAETAKAKLHKARKALLEDFERQQAQQALPGMDEETNVRHINPDNKNTE